MKKLIFIVLTVALTLGASPIAQAGTSISKLTVVANGANESPNTGSKTGSASGTFTLDATKRTFCFSNMKTKGLTKVVGAHVHLGASGIDGSIFVSFDFSKFNKSGRTCLKVDRLVLLDIAKYPTDYYFNVHTKTFPGGAVRGQLKKIS
ncbi:MAG: CHRD domain-containing protein [Actinobacteria bacterium]|nr:CHRD domain-containing protein [Actinomycetota bacterium]